MKACRRRCFIVRGTGICSAVPPPAAPLIARIRKSGATESIASVMYKIGFKGSWDAGGAPGIKGRFGLIVGGEAVRKWLSIMAVFCILHR